MEILVFFKCFYFFFEVEDWLSSILNDLAMVPILYLFIMAAI